MKKGRKGTTEMFIAYAIMEVAIWGFVTIAAIHFNSIHLYWFAILGSFTLPTFKKTSNDEDTTSNEKFRLNINKNEGNEYK